MAEISTSNSSNKKSGVKRMIKKSTKVDLTPMVDLGFLLVTFFVFTTTMAEPKAMKMYMPKDADVATKVCETCALTILLGKDDHLFYHEGSDKNAVYKQTTYSAEGLRKIISEKKKAVIRSTGEDNMSLIIKSSDVSSLKNLVDVIDESSIGMVKRYFMAELNEKDKEKIQ